LAKLKKFYDLDNAAKIFPAVSNEARTYMFRLSVVFKELIDPLILKEALIKTTKRYSHLNVRIRRGLFWFFFEENIKEPILLEDNGLVNEFLFFRENNEFLFRTLYYKERLSVEFYHALTDGKGALEFINSLAYEYLRLKGIKIDHEGLLITTDAASSYAEVRDEFKKLYQKQPIFKEKEPKAEHFTGTLYANHYTSVLHAYFKVDEIVSLAKKYDASVTALFGAISILAHKRSHQFKKFKHPFRLFIPVNMRQFFPAITLRNFASFIRVNYDLNQDIDDIGEIIKFVKEEMEKELNLDQMVNRIISNVKIEQSPLLRITPLYIKTLAMKSAYGLLGEALNSFSISNLGKVNLPKDMIPHISHYQFIIGASYETPKNLSIVSFGNTLTVSFISKIIERDIEKAFFDIFKELNIASLIEHNNWEVI